ncbi:SLOG family protein [Dysosmobacter sp.]|uniref:SLOG family protein n=1 Tax=Dysosmobacter sp. TaxID=2591382 RepID=UPI002A88DA1A|nr:SLOG family protein [Dysosmobacter sp.]MDY3282003.1 SLOG family protein [Dysosmobacter sp.]
MRGRQWSCSFTGHRPAKLPWGYREEDPRCLVLKRRIRDAVEAAYQEGYRHFLCGMAMGCDLYFCECVLALRSRHGDVTLEAVLPCPEQADTWPEAERQRYRALVKACDDETMVAQRYTAGCMQRRNRYLVDHSSLLIAAYDGSAGGTRNTIQYALSQGVQIADLPIPAEFPESK